MKDILVTGAYGGMGKAFTAQMAEQGYRIFALDKITEAPKDNIIPIEADVTQKDSLENALREVKSYTEELFAIVHFAGMYRLDSLVEMTDEEFSLILNVNFRGAYLVNAMFLPLLQKGSKILITTSELATLDPLPFTGIYAVTKAALDKYAYSLAMELQLLGISVSVLRAGAVDTGMLGVSTDALERFCEKTALYSCNANRFKAIVEKVEARCISPKKLAKKACRILSLRRPAFAYSINRNPLLILLGLLPKRLQLWIIQLILK